MADNIAVTPGSGATVATDDVGGVQYQRVKISLGADGSATDALGGAGAVAAGVQRTTLASDDPLVTAVGATSDAAATAGSTGSVSSKLRLLTSVVATEDAAASSGFAGVAGLTVRRDADAVTAGTDGDFAELQTNEVGKLKTAASFYILNNTASFTRPADTTAYAAGDLIANSTTAGSVTPMQVTVMRTAAGASVLTRCRLRKSGTAASLQARVHLWAATITVTNGDNGAFAPSGSADYLGSFDVLSMQSCSDGRAGIGLPTEGRDIDVKLASGSVVFCLIEALSAYTPVSGETMALMIASRPQ